MNLAVKSRVVSILPRSDQNYAKHSALIDLIKLLEDVEKCPYLLAQSTKGKTKKSHVHRRRVGTAHNSMLVHDNLLEGVWMHLKPSLG